MRQLEARRPAHIEYLHDTSTRRAYATSRLNNFKTTSITSFGN
jgi:hypothetical protein